MYKKFKNIRWIHLQEQEILEDEKCTLRTYTVQTTLK